MAIEEGTFLGMCADCGAGRGEAPQAPMSARAAGGMTGGKLALMAGAGVFAMIVVVVFLTMNASDKSVRAPVQMQQNVISK